ncbi:MAG: M20/M25/M40 family metallo-hydrolase [Hyphomicrobiales bacterium]|nr:M20/M25/M40 family metallo-hydrolase [Hyphomicrobiales bacterium]MDE2017880.1 M20/M25/M40 family metallo-hydrolase [Hyphomicrobiales bacterium]
MAALDDALGRIDAGREAALKRLADLIAIPSISADPARWPDCTRAADWLVDALKEIGADASRRDTAGRPMVVGHLVSSNRDAPRVLFYGHYDVQPPDPLELWSSPPFEATIVGDGDERKLRARGASDDKGQLMTFVEACRAFKEAGGPPCNVTFLFEGEEESGSTSLPAFLAANSKELDADVALVCDTDMLADDVPAVTTMLRGLVYEDVTVQAADRDLHSGLYGGAAANPIRVLARALAGLHDSDGRVTLEGFYDGVEELPEEIAEQWRAFEAADEAMLADVGLSVPAGEKGRSAREMIWSRPTCEFNGIVGGYTGVGAKTVLPAKASAKVSFRLVGAQDPAKVSESFRRHMRAAMPADCRVEFESHGASPAISLPARSEALTRARRALEAEWGKPAALVGSGGSIPIVGAFKRALKLDALLIGFASPDDGIHSPDEGYRLRAFHKGARSWARVLAAIGA